MKKHFLKLFTVSIIAVLGSCSQNKPIDLSKENNVKSYKYGNVISKRLSSSIKLPGELKPFEEVKIFPKVNGFVKDIFVDRGSKVHKGEVLITLDAPEILQQLLAAKSKYLQANESFHTSKNKYERLLIASKTEGAVSAFDLESVKSKMDEDEAMADAEKSNVSALESLTGYLTITAPFDGVISERNVHPGALVGPNAKMEMPLLKLEQENKLRLVVDIPEVFTNKINYDSKVMFALTSLPNRKFESIINRSAGALNTSIRAEAVEIDVTSNDNFIKPGMYAEVTIPLSSDASSYIVPASAVITSTERKYIIKVENKKTKFIDVQEGISRNDSTEIFGEMNGKETILINGNTEIKENKELQL